MTINHSKRPQIPTIPSQEQSTRDEVYKLQCSIEPEIKKKLPPLDDLIFKIINQKKNIETNTMLNVRYELINQIHEAGIRLFPSIEENSDISSYEGNKNENRILAAFINDFGEKIIHKENYKKALKGQDIENLLLNLNKENKNNIPLYEEINKWIHKYKKCKNS